jgi:hypothetical protein
MVGAMNRSSWKRRIRHLDWEAVAGIVAAVSALVLHLLHIVDMNVLVIIIMVLLALLLVRDLHREDREERLATMAEDTGRLVERLAGAMTLPETVLIGPRQLRDHSDRFARDARGEMVWFNVCLLMFRPQVLFDSLLRPAIENPNVSRIRFILDPGERERWEQEVLPKARSCSGNEKLLEPHWVPLDEAVSFILADVGDDGGTEAQLSFWGEPFMARSTTHDVPRYIFHVHAHSALIPRLVEMERNYRMQTQQPRA